MAESISLAFMMRWLEIYICLLLAITRQSSYKENLHIRRWTEDVTDAFISLGGGDGGVGNSGNENSASKQQQSSIISEAFCEDSHQSASSSCPKIHVTYYPCDITFENKKLTSLASWLLKILSGKPDDVRLRKGGENYEA